MFLIGAIFGLLATGKYPGFPKSKIIGGVGAVNSPLIRRWSDGLMEGIKYVNPKEPVKIAWTNSFNDPATAKELALSQYDAGAKYIGAFSASGNTGIFEAAKQDNFYTSGVDTDQRPVDPKHILVSMVKRSDIAVEQAVCDWAHGKFTGVTKTYGLKEKGNGPEFLVLPKKDLKTPSRVPAAVQAIIRSFATKIIHGQIKVTP
jgi:basic membrane protein A